MPRLGRFRSGLTFHSADFFQADTPCRPSSVKMAGTWQRLPRTILRCCRLHRRTDFRPWVMGCKEASWFEFLKSPTFGVTKEGPMPKGQFLGTIVLLVVSSLVACSTKQDVVAPGANIPSLPPQPKGIS